MDRSVLARKPMTELKEIASHVGMTGFARLRKADLIDAIIEHGAQAVVDREADGGDALDESDAEGGERSRTRSRTRTRDDSAGDSEEHGARKVLPPTERDTDGPVDSDDVAAPEKPSDGRASTDDSDDPGSGNKDSDTGGSDTGDSDGEDSDDEDSGQRKRRSRRDRRKRNRDRQDDSGGDTSGQDNSGQDNSGQDRAGQNKTQSDSGKGDDADSTGGGSDSSNRAHDSSNRDQSSSGPDQGRKGSSDKSGGRGQSGKQSNQGSSKNDDDKAPGEVRAGVLDILPEGYGFLRTTGYTPGERDVYVSQGQVRKHGLRRGDVVQGPIRPQRNNEKVPALHHVQKVNGEELEDGQVAERPDFDDLPVMQPDVRIDLAAHDQGNAQDGDRTSARGGSDILTARLVDMVAPIGQGQRALVIGSTHSDPGEVLRLIGNAMSAAADDAHVMYVMVDARPEDVARATAQIEGEVIASTFDNSAEEHCQIAELAIERARRLVELGHDVIVLLDSITRLARAYGVTVNSSGRAIAGDVDAVSLYPVKRFLASARTIADGGSLTMVAIATSGPVLGGNSPAADQVILAEVQRVANAQIVLDDRLATRRVRPPIDVLASGTSSDDRLQPAEEVATMAKLRRALETMSPADATELILDKVAQTHSNADFLEQIQAAGLEGGS